MLRYPSITVSLLVCLSCCGSGSDSNFLSYFLPSFLKQSSPQTYTVAIPETACTGCSQKITLIADEHSNVIPQEQFSFSDSLITTLRIEYIKNQILKKLRLKEKPAVSLDNLPDIVKENDYIMSKIRDDIDEEYSDDFYAKTTRAIVFPYEGIKEKKIIIYFAWLVFNDALFNSPPYCVLFIVSSFKRVNFDP